jgi:hypothetical protein
MMQLNNEEAEVDLQVTGWYRACALEQCQTRILAILMVVTTNRALKNIVVVEQCRSLYNVS